jgi:hypothetical protein
MEYILEMHFKITSDSVKSPIIGVVFGFKRGKITECWKKYT